MTSSIDEDIDRRLRTWADDLRAQAPTITMPELQPPRRRRWIRMVAAAAAVAVIAVGATILADRARDDSPSRSAPAGPPPLSTDPLPPGPGLQEFAYRGLAVNVPKAWPLNSVLCGNPKHDTVYVDNGGPTASCSSPTPPSTQWVVFSPLSPDSTAGDWFADITKVGGKQIAVDGVSGVRAEGASNQPPSVGRYVVTVAVPQLKVLVSFVAPTAAQARRLAKTLHRVPATLTHSSPATDAPPAPTLRRVEVHAPTASVVHSGRTYSESLVGRDAIARSPDGRTQNAVIGQNEIAVLYLKPGSYVVSTSNSGVCGSKPITVGASNLRVELNCALP